MNGFNGRSRLFVRCLWKFVRDPTLRLVASSASARLKPLGSCEQVRYFTATTALVALPVALCWCHVLSTAPFSAAPPPQSITAPYNEQLRDKKSKLMWELEEIDLFVRRKHGIFSEFQSNQIRPCRFNRFCSWDSDSGATTRGFKGFHDSLPCVISLSSCRHVNVYWGQ